MIGVDEVGRGSWAGPLLVVAARLKTSLPAGLADSKLLSKKQRLVLHDSILESCELGEGWVHPLEIDKVGLAEALRLGVERALTALSASSNELIIMDGKVNYCAATFTNVSCVVDADALYPIVSAASIYAKVQRDKYMTNIAKLFPGYGFEAHVGYGTRAHSDYLKLYGVCTQHRRSFKPIQVLLGSNS